MANFGFSTEDYQASDNEFTVMPKGEYRLRATEAEAKDTKKGDGQYLAVTFEVHSGEFKGRKIWQNFNINNPSDKAQAIGREQVAGWARAAGKPNARDSDDLIDRPFNCVLDIEKGTGGYSDKNFIKSFLTGDAKPAPAPTQAKGKFDDEPAPKKAEPKEEAPKKSEPKEEAPSSAKKNPWD